MTVPRLRNDRPDFCTLGMFILDEIHFPPPRSPVFNVLGGAGTYAVLGARLFSPAPDLSRDVEWTVHMGFDFPEAARQSIDTWQTNCAFHSTPWRETTRIRVDYDKENDTGAQRWMTEKIHITADSLTTNQLRSKVFHLVCSSSRAIELVTGIKTRRDFNQSRPIFIWEPTPNSCTPEGLQVCCEALKHIDVFSPNHTELCKFFGEDGRDEDGNVAKATVEKCASKMLSYYVGPGGDEPIIVRASKEGCFVATKERNIWLPCYHGSAISPNTASKVQDPTGGGNAFMGGLGVALARQDSKSFEDVMDAALFGSVAASFAIEQVGMPLLSCSEHGWAHSSYTDEEEKWNGEKPKDRLSKMRWHIREVLGIGTEREALDALPEMEVVTKMRGRNPLN